MAGATGIAGNVGANSVSRFPQAQIQTANSVQSSSGTVTSSNPFQKDGGETVRAVQVSISPAGQLLSSLAQLKSEDPTQFAQVSNRIASDLRTASDQAGQTTAGKLLGKLCDEFKTAAETGDVSAIHKHLGSSDPTVQIGNRHVDSATSEPALKPASESTNNNFRSTISTGLQQLFATLATEANSVLVNSPLGALSIRTENHAVNFQA